MEVAAFVAQGEAAFDQRAAQPGEAVVYATVIAIFRRLSPAV